MSCRDCRTVSSRVSNTSNPLFYSTRCKCRDVVTISRECRAICARMCTHTHASSSIYLCDSHDVTTTTTTTMFLRHFECRDLVFRSHDSHDTRNWVAT